jgi:predicted metal-dependent hydrolase
MGRPCFCLAFFHREGKALPLPPAGAQIAPLTYNKSMDHGFDDGIRLFNSRKYFEAHEALEAVWLKTEGDRKLFLHGLIQIAAAFHHHGRGNPAGCRSLLEKGLRKLERFGRVESGIDLMGLRDQLQPWRDYLEDRKRAQPAHPPLPRILKAIASV